MLESNSEWAAAAGRAAAEGWHEDPHFAEDHRAWFAAVGPWALGVYEYSDGRVTWGVNGPDVGGEDVDVGGTAGSVGEAMRASVSEVRRIWATYGDALADLERAARPE